MKKIHKNHNYIDGRTLKTYYCIDCGKELSKSAYQGAKRCKSCENKRRYKNPENHPNYNKKHPGINLGRKNPNYIDGRKLLKYPSEFNTNLKEFIRKRDNYICQKCGKIQKNHCRKLAVHHIDYNKFNCKKNNLISICNKCNAKVNFNRDYWYSYFIYIMENL